MLLDDSSDQRRKTGPRLTFLQQHLWLVDVVNIKKSTWHGVLHTPPTTSLEFQQKWKCGMQFYKQSLSQMKYLKKSLYKNLVILFKNLLGR